MSWLFSQALVEEYSEDICLDGEQSVQLNGNNIQQAYCAPDKMTGFSRLSRFGMTYKPLTESRGEELCKLYREAFLAKILVQRGGGRESKASEAECGEKWRGWLTKFDQNTSLWKTAQCSLLGDLEQFLETWPRWGLMRNGECYQRQTLAHLTGVIESGFSPDNVTTFHTPMTTGLDGGSNGRKALKKKQETIPTPTSSVGGANHNSPSTLAGKRWAMNLSGYAQKYPTPTVCGNYNQKGASPTSGDGLATFVKKYPTPTAHNAKETNAPSEALRNEPSLASIAGGKLNPTWVEWLMGWPLGWTDLKQLEMGKYHSWLQQHGKF